MPRARKGAARTQKHKKILKSTRGQIGAASRRYRVAREAWLRAGRYATIGRKLRKRDFRQLWITRVSAACRQRGLTYSRFMNSLAGAGIALNRKMLSEVAIADPGAFDEIVAVASGAKPTSVPQPAPAEAPEAEAPLPAPAEKKPAEKKAAPKKAAPKKAAPKKAAPKRAAPKKAAGKQGEPKPAGKKAATRKKTAAKAAKDKPKAGKDKPKAGKGKPTAD